MTQHISTHVRGQGWGTPKEVGGPDAKQWFVSALFPWFVSIHQGIISVFQLWCFLVTIDYRYVAISGVKDETRDVGLKEVLVGVPAKCLIKLGSWFKMFLSRKWSVSHKLILKHCRSGGLSGQLGVDIGSWLLTRLTPQKSTSKN